MGFYRCNPASGGGDVDSFYITMNGNKYLFNTNNTFGNDAITNSVTIGDNIKYCGNLFSSASSFNVPVTIGNNVTSCLYMFYGARNFNQPIDIPDSVENCLGMFRSCNNLNRYVNFGNNITTCNNMFEGCSIYAPSPSEVGRIDIPDSVLYCCSMFYNCKKYDRLTTIGKNVRNCHDMFAFCTSFGTDIYFMGNKVTFVGGMFRNCNNSLRKNLHFNSTLNSIFNNTQQMYSLVYYGITWYTMTNGFYNSAYNIYCYNNFAIS